MKKSLSYLAIIVGGFITAYGLEAILIPNNVSDGGVTGLGIVGAKVFGIPLAVFLLLGNIPFLYLGCKQIGKTFALKSIVGIISLAIGTQVMHNVPTIIEGDTLLITVTGGIVIGFGMGLALRNGGALDGIDMLAVLLSRKLPFGTGDIILGLNVFVFAIVSTTFGLQGALLSGIAYFVAKTVIEMVEVGLSSSVAVRIVTKKDKELASAIQKELGRSVTLSDVEGGFTGEKFKSITCIITQLEESKIKTIINDIDSEAFYTFTDVTEVKGGTFKKNNIH